MKQTSKNQKKKNLRKQFDVKLLDQLVTDETSCIQLHKTQHHLALHPYHLSDLNNSVKDLLNKELSKYNPELDGILCGYKNITFLTEVGRICEDSCFIHVDIEADFFIFKPILGKLLKGVVKKKSKDHVGCLVHHLFNVSLPKPKNVDQWVGSSLELDSEVQFVVSFTNFEGTLPYILGEIVEVLNESVKKGKKIKFDETLDDFEAIDQLFKMEEDEGEIRKKKKKRKRDIMHGQDEEVSQQDEEGMKKNKRKRKHEQDDESSVKKKRKKKTSE